MTNLPLSERRCAGTDHKPNPTICPQRAHCRRHQQLELDRELKLPPEVKVQVMSLPRVGRNECHYLVTA
jgi:hypothetical protein